MRTGVDLQKVKECFLKKIAGSITEEEELFLQQWIDSSPQNRALAEHIFSKEFLIAAVSTDEKSAADTVWQKIYRQLNYAKKHYLLTWWIGAAMITVAVGSYFMLQEQEAVITPGSSRAILYDLASNSVELPFENEGRVFDFSQHVVQNSSNKEIALSPDLHRTIEVPYGGEYQILLEDSSLIHLGPGSSLSIPVDFSKEKRSINLAGKAYLAIHKDAEHPFEIQTAHALIRVLGTRLNVEAYDDEHCTRVLLEQGRLEVKSAKGVEELPVGSMAIIGEDNQICISEANVAECVAWHHNRIVFENQPLELIMKRLSRWYNFEVAYSSDRIRNLHLTMDVNKYDTFNKLADAIEKMGDVIIQIKDKNVVLISERNLNQE